jgi:hypothetical protein
MSNTTTSTPVATNKDDTVAVVFGHGALNRQAGVGPWARKNRRLTNSVAAKSILLVLWLSGTMGPGMLR